MVANVVAGNLLPFMVVVEGNTFTILEKFIPDNLEK
jgi:hypothetical protein